MKRHLVAVAALLLLVPSISAGSEEAPEIRDEMGDVRWDGALLGPSPFEQTAALDVVKSWFHDENATHVQVTMVVADLARVQEFDAAYARWGTRFQLTNYEPDTRNDWWNYTWIISVHLNNGPRGWRASVELPDRGGERGTSVDVPFATDLDGNRFTVTVPRNVLGSPKAGDRMFDTLSLHDGDIVDNSARLHHNDQSPTGEGRDFVFTMDTPDAEAGLNQRPVEPTTQEAPGVGLLLVLSWLLVAVLRRR